MQIYGRKANNNEWRPFLNALKIGLPKRPQPLSLNRLVEAVLTMTHLLAETIVHSMSIPCPYLFFASKFAWMKQLLESRNHTIYIKWHDMTLCFFFYYSIWGRIMTRIIKFNENWRQKKNRFCQKTKKKYFGGILNESR